MLERMTIYLLLHNQALRPQAHENSTPFAKYSNCIRGETTLSQWRQCAAYGCMNNVPAKSGAHTSILKPFASGNVELGLLRTLLHNCLRTNCAFYVTRMVKMHNLKEKKIINWINSEQIATEEID